MAENHLFLVVHLRDRGKSEIATGNYRELLTHWEANEFLPEV
ncbi:MAG: hypothetical protein ACL7BU_16245 [Candidatus Phlomobacter fragariae]